MPVEMAQQAEQPRWLLAMLRRLATDSSRLARRDPARYPTAALKAKVRLLLADRLGSAFDAGDGCAVVVVAELVRSLDSIDAWMDAVSASESSDVVAHLEGTRGGPRALAESLRAHGPAERERLAKEAIHNLQAVGVPRQFCEHAGRAMNQLIQSESQDIRHEALRTLSHMAESLSVPAWRASGHFRSAIAVMDRRMHQDLERLDDHADWLAACADIWCDPGAAVLMASLRQRARRRSTLAMCAQKAHWAKVSDADRDIILRVSRDIVAGVDDPATHERLASIAASLPRDQVVKEALQAIEWPTDPLERLTWTGPDRCDEQAGTLLMALEARHWFAQMRWTRLWRKACDQAEEAAAAVLACLDSAPTYHA